MDFVIGNEIKKVVNKKGLKNKTFASLMNMEERNLYHFFKREQIDIDLLLKASEVLDVDFVSLYIENSKFKNHLKRYESAKGSELVNDLEYGYEKENQISFSICVKGSFEKVSSEMSNILQLVKKEVEDRGLSLG